MASRTIDLISKKKQIARATHFFLISKKKNFAEAAHFFLISKKKNKFARAAGFLSFFAVVLQNYNAVL